MTLTALRRAAKRRRFMPKRSKATPRAVPLGNNTEETAPARKGLQIAAEALWTATMRPTAAPQGLCPLVTKEPYGRGSCSPQGRTDSDSSAIDSNDATEGSPAGAVPVGDEGAVRASTATISAVFGRAKPWNAQRFMVNILCEPPLCIQRLSKSLKDAASKIVMELPHPRHVLVRLLRSPFLRPRARACFARRLLPAAKPQYPPH